MLMPGRNGGENYRYSFNGMEQDDEVSGKGNSLTTPFRMYNPRLGRWMSTDPITHPQFSPYSAFDNNPIYYSDPSGADSEKRASRYAKKEGIKTFETRKLANGGTVLTWNNKEGAVGKIFKTNAWEKIGRGFSILGSIISSAFNIITDGISNASRSFDKSFNISGIHLTNNGVEGFYAVTRKGVGDEKDLELGELVIPTAPGVQLTKFNPSKAFKSLPKSQQTKLYKDLNLLFKTVGVTIDFGGQLGEAGKAFQNEYGTPALTKVTDKEVEYFSQHPLDAKDSILIKVNKGDTSASENNRRSGALPAWNTRVNHKTGIKY